MFILVSSNLNCAQRYNCHFVVQVSVRQNQLTEYSTKICLQPLLFYWYKTKYCLSRFFPWETNRGQYSYLTKSFNTQRLGVDLGSNVYTLSSAGVVVSDRKLTGIVDSCFMIVVIVRMSITMINLSRVTPFVLF